MRKLVIALPLLALCACGTSGGLFGRERPDEFAVTRNAPLVVPPDYTLVPPRPGDPRATANEAQAPALRAVFGGAAPRSATETGVLNQADSNRAASGIRSTVGDPQTEVVNRGTLTRDILASPEGDGRDARVTPPAGAAQPAPQPQTAAPQTSAPQPQPTPQQQPAPQPPR